MNELEKLREEIDQIDRQMVSLFEKRMGISARVADYKIANGKKVFDKEREQEKMDAVDMRGLLTISPESRTAKKSSVTADSFSNGGI